MLLIQYLNENISRYDTLFSCNQDSIFILDIKGHVVQANPAFEEITGFSTEETKLLKLQLLFPIEHVNKVFHHFHKTILGHFENFDCKMINKNGQIIELNMTNIPISVNNQIVGVWAVARDITELKRKKEELRKIEEMQRLLTDNVLDLMISTNMQGEILYVSPSCQYILGYTGEEVMNQNCLSFIHVNDTKKAYRNRKKVLSTQENSRDCYRVRKKDGDYIWVESLCKPIIDPETKHVLEVVSVVRDISERMKVEEEERKREETFRNLIEYSPDAVMIASGEDILFINETGARLLGAANKEEILKMKILDLIHPDFHEIASKRERIIKGGAVTDFLEYKLNRIDGTILIAEVKSLPTIFNNKSAKHIIIRDITERKKTQELLLNSEKLNVAGQLAAGIAHEVRNPLTSIKGFLQLMKVQLDSSNKTYFDIIQAEIDRIELILNELLVLAKPHELKVETVELITLIENVKTLIDTQAIINNIQIETIYNCKNVMINGDKNQLKQVFINILKNAIEAMPQGGGITIEVKEHSFNMVKLFFKDTGKGMPLHILKRVGEPFFTTKEGGTGLGIMISKQIIDHHDGTIHFWSDQQGTIIEVILPLAKHK